MPHFIARRQTEETRYKWQESKVSLTCKNISPSLEYEVQAKQPQVISMSFSIIIPVFNSEKVLPECLESLAVQTHPPLEIILVDNGSTDDGVRNAQQRWPDLKVIRNEENQGYAGGCNQGIRKVSGDYTLLLNDDARLDRFFLENAEKAFEEHPEAGSVSGKVYRAEKPILDSTGIMLQKRKFSPSDRGENEEDRGQYNQEQYVFGPSGAAACYRTAALEDARIGDEYLDEDFFAYYEDVDLSWRLQLLGWRCLYRPDAVAFHDRKGPERKDRRIYVRSFANRYLCYIKNELPGCLSGYLPFGLPYELGRCVKLFLLKPYMVFSVISFLQRLPNSIRKRRIIQSRRKASKEYMSQFE